MRFVEQVAQRGVRLGSGTVAPNGVEEVVLTGVLALRWRRARLRSATVVGFQVDSQAVLLHVQTDTSLETVVVAVLHDTVLIVVREGSVVACFGGTTRHREAVVGLYGIAEDDVLPIVLLGIAIVLQRHTVVVGLTLQEGSEIGIVDGAVLVQQALLGGEVAVLGFQLRLRVHLALQADELIGIHHWDFAGDMLHAHATIVGNLRRTDSAFLRADNHNAVRTTATVNRRCRSVFQDINTLYIVRVDGRGYARVFHRETIHDIQRRVVLRNRVTTADDDTHLATRHTFARRHIHTRHAPCQGLVETGDRRFQHLLHVRLGNRPCQVLLADILITDDHHFIKGLLVLVERDEHRLFLAVDIQFLGLETEVGNHQHVFVVDAQREVSVEVGHSTRTRPLDKDVHTNQGFSVLVHNRSHKGRLCAHANRSE